MSLRWHARDGEVFYCDSPVADHLMANFVECVCTDTSAFKLHIIVCVVQAPRQSDNGVGDLGRDSRHVHKCAGPVTEFILCMSALSGISSFEGLIKERNLVIHSDNAGAEWAMRNGMTLAQDCLHSDT